MKRLREAANRLKTPDQADAFTFWADYCMERRATHTHTRRFTAPGGNPCTAHHTRATALGVAQAWSADVIACQ